MFYNYVFHLWLIARFWPNSSCGWFSPLINLPMDGWSPSLATSIPKKRKKH
jgi:hypothetical protein